jgi:CRISPR-associated protein Csy2
MEDGILILRHIRVENANAISGVTWGFPAVTHFLGFVHALSRDLPARLDLKLTGCGIVCHSHQIQAYQPKGWGDYVFSLTRNPLTKNEKSPSFVEEGRMHMDVSLVIPFEGDYENFEDEADNVEACDCIRQHIFSKKLAGGTINSLGEIQLLEMPGEEKETKKFTRKLFYQLLPGFVLAQRSELLAAHVSDCKRTEPDGEPLDAWLDFSALKYEADQVETEASDEEPETVWRLQPRPGKGWLVPITTGYRGISDLYGPGEVQRARDNSVPFRFVESVYTIGEWLSPHRLTNFEQMIWRYKAVPESGWYFCKNNDVHNELNP